MKVPDDLVQEIRMWHPVLYEAQRMLVEYKQINDIEIEGIECIKEKVSFEDYIITHLEEFITKLTKKNLP